MPAHLYNTRSKAEGYKPVSYADMDDGIDEVTPVKKTKLGKSIKKDKNTKTKRQTKIKKNSESNSVVVIPSSTDASTTVSTDKNATQYPARSGKLQDFNTNSTDVFTSSGFFPGQRVNTPLGPAKVIGEADGEVWFFVESDQGASYWGGYRTSDFVHNGFVALN